MRQGQKFKKLSEKETEIMQAIIWSARKYGLVNNSEILKRCKIKSLNTLNTHKKSIFSKLNVYDMVAAIIKLNNTL